MSSIQGVVYYVQYPRRGILCPVSKAWYIMSSIQGMVCYVQYPRRGIFLASKACYISSDQAMVYGNMVHIQGQGLLYVQPKHGKCIFWPKTGVKILPEI